MDTAHNKVVVYVRVRPYAYDCEVDVDNGKAVKDGVKCIIQLRKVNTPEVGQKDSGGKTNQATLPNTVRVKNDADNTFHSFTFDGVFNSFVPKTVPSHATQSSIWNESVSAQLSSTRPLTVITSTLWRTAKVGAVNRIH